MERSMELGMERARVRGAGRLAAVTVAVGLLAGAGSPVWATPPAAPHRATQSAPVPSGTPQVNINTASEVELGFLPGIGPKKAEAIVQRRTRKHFSRPEELLQIKGIGRTIYRRCKPYVTLRGPTTAAGKIRKTK